MNHIETYQEIASHLGATFWPMSWGTEPPSEDRGYLVFGDETDWRTLRLFIYPGHGKFCIHYDNQAHYFDGDRTKVFPTLSIPVHLDAINIAVTRDPSAIAKDIKRRLLEAAQIKHPEGLKALDASTAKADEQKAWNLSIGLPAGKDHGDVWRGQNLARATIENATATDVTMKLQWISRHQTEAVLALLRSM